MIDDHEKALSPSSRPSLVSKQSTRRRSSFTISPNKEMSLEEIQKELKELTAQAHQGIQINEKRFDWLLRKQLSNKDYQQVIEEEKVLWRESVTDFAEQCLERTRSFIPVNVFHSSQEDLMNLGLSSELSKRILQRQCLWLVRMSKAEISRLHESDLIGRFNSLGQQLDIIETAAIYATVPERFYGDATGKKEAWKDAIEENLRQMLLDNDHNTLSDARRRHPLYEGKQFGPVEDVTSVRENKITSGRQSSSGGRKSFIAVCQQNSIMAKLRGISNTDNVKHETPIKEAEQEQVDNYEEDDGILDTDEDEEGDEDEEYYDEEGDEEYYDEEGDEDEEYYDEEGDEEYYDEEEEGEYEEEEGEEDIRDTLNEDNAAVILNDEDVFSDDESDEEEEEEYAVENAAGNDDDEQEEEEDEEQDDVEQGEGNNDDQEEEDVQEEGVNDDREEAGEEHNSEQLQEEEETVEGEHNNEQEDDDEADNDQDEEEAETNNVTQVVEDLENLNIPTELEL